MYVVTKKITNFAKKIIFVLVKENMEKLPAPMNYENLYNDLIIEFRKKIPQNSKLAAKLSEILFLEKEAVYRRLRGEVPFKLQEIVAITNELGISLDNTIGIGWIKRPPCQLQSINYENPAEIDYMMLENYVEILKAMAFEPDGEMSMVTNLFPQSLYLKFKYINRFYFFRWHYHHLMLNQPKTYQEIVFPKRLEKHIEAVSIESKNIKTSHYILDGQVFQNFINNVRYFYSIRLLKTEDVSNIKKELFHFVDYMEDLAVSGYFEGTKNKVSLYISDISIDTNYSYMDSQNIRFSLIWAFLLNGVSTYDEKTLEVIKTWIHSIIKTSTLISVTGEKPRTLYFERQREIIEEL
ncbi:hypothetical protein FACS189426_19530 [Bacteroidia bacterium]|nr:hypothetical protein FACS189426_19530 [Bacteroidia bacterium]GHT84253.1 hypothetical protein FACS18947_1450 [Bacteroidia bacterium]